MANEKQPDPPGGRRRRDAPTIDLKATEIPASAETSDASEPAPAKTAAEGARFSFAPDEGEPVRAAEPPPVSPPPDEPKARTGGAAWPPSGAAIGAFASGAGAALVIFLLIIWIVGPFRSRDDAAMAM